MENLLENLDYNTFSTALEKLEYIVETQRVAKWGRKNARNAKRVDYEEN